MKFTSPYACHHYYEQFKNALAKYFVLVNILIAFCIHRVFPSFSSFIFSSWSQLFHFTVSFIKALKPLSPTTGQWLTVQGYEFSYRWIQSFHLSSWQQSLSFENVFYLQLLHWMDAVPNFFLYSATPSGWAFRCQTRVIIELAGIFKCWSMHCTRHSYWEFSKCSPTQGFSRFSVVTLLAPHSSDIPDIPSFIKPVEAKYSKKDTAVEMHSSNFRYASRHTHTTLQPPGASWI